MAIVLLLDCDDCRLSMQLEAADVRTVEGRNLLCPACLHPFTRVVRATDPATRAAGKKHAEQGPVGAGAGGGEPPALPLSHACDVCDGQGEVLVDGVETTCPECLGSARGADLPRLGRSQAVIPTVQKDREKRGSPEGPTHISSVVSGLAPGAVEAEDDATRGGAPPRRGSKR